MIVHCPACKTRYRVDPARLAGRRGRLRCARCTTVFPVLPEGEPASDAGHRVAEALVAARGAASRLDVAVVASEAGASRQHVVSALAHCRVRTVTVDDGPSCLDTARRSRPRLVVLGAWMRGLLGIEVAAQVLGDPDVARARIVLVGGPPPSGTHRADPARVAGVDAWLPEEASQETLEAAFRTLLDLPDGQPASEPDPEDVARFSRVAAADILLHHSDLVDAGLRAGDAPLRLQHVVDEARLSCAERFPQPGGPRRRALAALEAELSEALARRRVELGV